MIILLKGEGYVHGFTHTYIGASLIAIFSAFTGKYLSEFDLRLLAIKTPDAGKITWWVSLLSAFIGSYSHVFLDSIMHADLDPFYPLTIKNWLYNYISVAALHQFCIVSGMIGAAIYYIIVLRRNKA